MSEAEMTTDVAIAAMSEAMRSIVIKVEVLPAPQRLLALVLAVNLVAMKAKSLETLVPLPTLKPILDLAAEADGRKLADLLAKHGIVR